MTMRSPFHRWVVIALALGLVSGACSKKSNTGATTPPPTTPATSTSAPTSVYDVNLKGICPDKIVLQTDWFPEVEHGGAYNLIGPGGEIDAGKGTYTGPLKDTGVQMEIRAGGPFIGFSYGMAQMYADDNIFVAYSDTSDQISTYAKLPGIAIVAPLEKGPGALMYDPATYTFNSIADVKAAGAPVLYFEGSGAAFNDFLVGTGQLDEKQLDASYDGSPARFVAAEGKIVQQSFATNEPYVYEHDISEWGKPLKALLLYDAGFTIYQSNIVVRPETVTKYHDCLAKLVPMWQQSEVDYITNPGTTNDLILQIVTEMNTFWTLSEGLNAWASQTMRDTGITSNGSDSTLGNFDFDRLQTFMNTFVPIERFKGVDIPAGLTPQDLATNEFIDPNIGL
jgi:hypothetical protein